MSLDSVFGLTPLMKPTIGTNPIAGSAGTATGSAIDRTGFTQMTLVAAVGALTGTPTTTTVDAKVTHCATSGGTYVDWKPAGTAASGAITQMTAAGVGQKEISLKGAFQFLKIVTVVAFTGGTTPTAPNSVLAILSGADTQPASSDT
jgi:hypothetical protein